MKSQDVDFCNSAVQMMDLRGKYSLAILINCPIITAYIVVSMAIILQWNFMLNTLRPRQDGRNIQEPKREGLYVGN